MNFKKTLKTLSSLVFFTATVFFGFIFWASASNHPEKEYHQEIVNNYPISTTNDSVYTIATYNIGYLSGMTNNLPVAKTQTLFDDNLTTVYQAFQVANPDIICFQEIDYHARRSFYVNQQDALQDLGYNYIFQAVNWDVNYLPYPYGFPSDHHGEIFSGQSILSKYPLHDNQRIVLDRVAGDPFYYDAFYLDRLAQVSKISLDGRDVIVINVHFEAFDPVTRLKHANRVIHLYNQYKDQYPVLLVGDFNSDAAFDDAVIHLIIDLPDIRPAVNLSLKTFPSDAPEYRLDYIFYNDTFIEMASSSILKSVGESSDHLPVMMTFRLK